MSAVTEALRAYRAAVDESRRADYAKQQAAQALYEARQAEDRPRDAYVLISENVAASLRGENGDSE